MVDFVNIDYFFKNAKMKLKKGGFIVGFALVSAATAATAVTVTNNNKAKEERMIARENNVKVYKTYTVKPGDSLESIVQGVLDSSKETASAYTYDELLKEICFSSPIKHNHIEVGDFLAIPYYISEEQAAINEERARLEDEFYEKNRNTALELDEYENYVVKSGDTYWKIAYMYTDDNNEVTQLVYELQNLNNDKVLKMGDTIKIPNRERHRLLNLDYEEESKSFH